MAKKTGLFIFLCGYFAIAYTLFNYFGITCVFLEFFGLPCPGCGMTRAFLSVLRLDIVQAIKHNILIFFMPYIFMYIFFDFKSNIHKTILKIIAFVAIINWLIKIILYI